MNGREAPRSRDPREPLGGREPWRLLFTWDGEPAWNLALDEALLASAEARPTLRFYTWRPGALSLGYFQRLAEVGALAPELVVVRRFTGGGAIHHAEELTYAIAAAREHPLFTGEVARSYERIHALLARAFTAFGVRAEPRGARPLRSERPETGMCFHRSTAFDLVWDERKGVGSAQRRTGGRVLHHGSIKLGANALEPGVAALARGGAAPRPIELAEAIAAEFERALGCAFAREEPSATEREHATRRAPLFRSETFVRRR